MAEGAEATAAALLELGMLQSGMPADGPGGRRAAGGGLAASGGSHADLQARLQAQLDEARRRRAASEAVTANGRTQRPKVAHPPCRQAPEGPSGGKRRCTSPHPRAPGHANRQGEPRADLLLCGAADGAAHGGGGGRGAATSDAAAKHGAGGARKRQQ